MTGSALNHEVFLSTWLDSAGAERANKDSFLKDLCDVLGVPHPNPKTGDPAADTYVFERDAITPRPGETTTTKFIDLYKAGCFLLEAKQGSTAVSPKLGTARRDTPGWTFAMKEAYGQALGYARTFNTPPPFLVVADLGYCFDLYASFDGSWNYAPFPDAQHNRLFLRDLARHVDVLKAVWTDPWSLDPSRHAARVTEEVATHLAELAKSLDRDHPPELVAKFLMRCLFTMFAEDVGLLGDHLFTDSLERFWLPNPASFPGGVRSLWRAMNDGSDYVTGKLLRFNGGLFADPSALSLTRDQIGLLYEAAKCDWSDVEPAIFGTLLERALNPRERHKLGAHYTPRAYVERLVRPTILEPVREEWEAVQAEARGYLTAKEPDPNAAVRCVREFHGRLASIRVLDPACGSGNFLYVTLDLFKRLESEILQVLRGLGESEQFEMQTVRVSPRQFLGLEVNPWAKEIAELVLWIGYLQWHFRAYAGRVPIQEPVIEDTRSIVCRDAVLEYDRQELVTDAEGKPVSRWDGVTLKVHPVTGEEVPDEAARVPLYRYLNPRKAAWPKADFIVGNPPFMGNKRMRAAMGDGYVEALRATWGDVSETVDYVMYWWHHAADMVAKGEARRFGFITTNSITQTFNRKVVQAALGKGVRLAFAIPDHPWVESDTGAAVRIAMTCGSKEGGAGRLLTVTAESEGKDGTLDVVFREAYGVIHVDLSAGANVATAVPLESNRDLSFQGIIPLGDGFRFTRDQLPAVGVAPDALPPVVKRFVIGRDLVQRMEERFLIDFFGLSETEAMEQYPDLFQRVLLLVKPERDQNKRETRRRNWWLFGENAPKLRRAVIGISRVVATIETSRHKPFVFLPADWDYDHKVYVVASDDAFLLGVLSSKYHQCWALAAGGHMGVGNDPTWTSTTCFQPFAFPAAADGQQARIRDLGERLDGFRKERQALHPDLTLTGMYNVLAALREGRALSAKEHQIHEKGLVTVLKALHDDLDAAVADAYGWPVDLPDEEILSRLVALNAERAREEADGLVRWLRPEFQAKGIKAPAPEPGQTDLLPAPEAAPTSATTAGPAPWPKGIQERLAAVRARVSSEARPWSLQDVRASFKGARADQVEPILDSLAFLGHMVRVMTADGVRWQAAGRAP
jgi:hypothetical protein